MNVQDILCAAHCGCETIGSLADNVYGDVVCETDLCKIIMLWRGSSKFKRALARYLIQTLLLPLAGNIYSNYAFMQP